MAGIVESLSADLADARTAAVERKQREKIRRALAGLVFAYWAAKFDHPRALLDEKRERRLMSRLQECDDNVSDLLWALDGALKDPWIMGTDPRSTRPYDDIQTILRDREQVEKFGDRTRGFRENRIHPMAKKYLMPEEP
jgi:hypothetical protein